MTYWLREKLQIKFNNYFTISNKYYYFWVA